MISSGLILVLLTPDIEDWKIELQIVRRALQQYLHECCVFSLSCLWLWSNHFSTHSGMPVDVVADTSGVVLLLYGKDTI